MGEGAEGKTAHCPALPNRQEAMKVLRRKERSPGNNHREELLFETVTVMLHTHTPLLSVSVSVSLSSLPLPSSVEQGKRSFCTKGPRGPCWQGAEEARTGSQSWAKTQHRGGGEDRSLSREPRSGTKCLDRGRHI